MKKRFESNHVSYLKMIPFAVGAGLILIILNSLMGCASFQPVTFAESEYLTEVYEDVSGTKDELFLKASEWAVKSFGDSKSVIEVSDKAEGVLIGKYLMYGTIKTTYIGYGQTSTHDTRVYAIIDIRLKDNKARIQIKPQEAWKYDASGMTIYHYSKEQAKADMKKIADSFHNDIKKESIKF